MAFNVGGERRFIRIVEARHSVNLSRAGAPVDSLEVALLANFERSMNVDLQKIADLVSHLLAQRAIRRNGGNQNDHALARQEFRDESYPPDIFVPVRLAESEVAAKVLANDIAVEPFHPVAAGAKMPVDRLAECRFPGRAEASKPDC